MELDELQIIALDNPSPPDYGGAIDMYYKLLALKSVGVKIYLHVFHKQGIRNKLDKRLQQAIDEYYFYPRRTKVMNLLRSVPFAVCSRDSDVLIDNLKENVPLLFEGAHTTCQFDVIRSELPDQPIAIRGHNIETKYYRELSKHSLNPLKRFYYANESLKFASYEPKVYSQADYCFSVSSAEIETITSFGARAFWLPAFFCEKLPDASCIQKKPNGPRKEISVLFHANFEVSLNVRAAEWLLSKTPLVKGMKFIFAGRNAAAVSLANSVNDVVILNNPGKDMDKIISSSDLVVLPGKQKSGVKLKLLKTIGALKPVIATPETLEGSGFENILSTFNTGEELAANIEEWRNSPDIFLEQLASAVSYLRNHYQPQKNAEFLIRKMKKAAG